MTKEARNLLWVPQDDTRYTYAVAVVRALEQTLLGRKTLEAMARASTPEEALEELGETAYAKFMTPEPSIDELELLLERVLLDVYALFRQLILDEDLEQAVLFPHDLHNLKALLKGHLASQEPQGLVPYGIYDAETIGAALESGSYRDLPDIVEQTARAALISYELENDPRLVEIIVDQAALNCKITPLMNVESLVIPEYARLLADVVNIRLAVRLNHSDPDPTVLSVAFTDGGTIPLENLVGTLGKNPRVFADALSSTVFGTAARDGISYLQEEGSYAALDRELENILMNTLRGARFLIFGPGPLLAHIMAKEHEVNMVRLVMVGKMNKIPVERIVARLPLLYA